VVAERGGVNSLVSCSDLSSSTTSTSTTSTSSNIRSSRRRGGGGGGEAHVQLHLALEASLPLRQEGVLDLRRDGHLSFDVLQLIPQPHHLRGRLGLGHRRGPFGEAEHGSGNRGGPKITRRG
jgi:hypothetical protein